MEEGLCYVNGAFLPASEAKVSIFDRGFTSGEGVYDVTRSFGHKLFKLDEHIARLYRSLKYTRIDSGIPANEMRRLPSPVSATCMAAPFALRMRRDTRHTLFERN